MFVLLRDIADTDLIEKHINYSLNMTLKNQILKFISHMVFLTLTQNFKNLLMKSVKTIKVLLSVKNYVNLWVALIFLF